jgi:hypothetical protein
MGLFTELTQRVQHAANPRKREIDDFAFLTKNFRLLYGLALWAAHTAEARHLDRLETKEKATITRLLDLLQNASLSDVLHAAKFSALLEDEISRGMETSMRYLIRLADLDLKETDLPEAMRTPSNHSPNAETISTAKKPTTNHFAQEQGGGYDNARKYRRAIARTEFESRNSH